MGRKRGKRRPRCLSDTLGDAFAVAQENAALQAEARQVAAELERDDLEDERRLELIAAVASIEQRSMANRAQITRSAGALKAGAVALRRGIRQ